ncbi:hypothetical protein [Pseudidiomarina insulisalsae]|uniref:DUF5666 domain-containing protein n=1 Tax=Pseudidiomarina insulisalsae TaxID=575789 RepID=A0A432YQ79_9GAMM|nr:hypothetical protein [Pseudidiomarina insulisalsae]RUO63124.1 hypothetical protein CWI71_02565 [Pseudidiomarina insulisalsae]
MLRTTLLASSIIFALSGAAQAQDVKSMPDETWVSMSGEVASTTPTSFILDYGKGLITVEIGSWRWFQLEGHALLPGDDVTVYGEIDDDFAERATLDATSVYVDSLDSYFYAGTIDEASDEIKADFDVLAMDTLSPVDVNGTVTEVREAEREFVIDSGMQAVTVDTSDMSANLLDDEGFQQIEVGDYVSVAGEWSSEIVGSLEIKADRIVSAEVY